jgi:tripartite-type tricarboxylate transporter receptor subunit TctC
MSPVRSILAAALFASALVAAPPAVRAEDFYKGKRITIIVGNSVGGGFDTYGRAVAKHLGNHIPGNPTVIVQNMPGAGSLVAVRALNATQPKDGTVIVAFNSGLIPQAIVQPSTVNVDFRKYAWVGVASPLFGVCFGYGPKGVASWDDLLKSKTFILGATGKGTISYVNGAILRAVFGAPVKQVLGFPGTAEQQLAIERGELDGDCSDYSSIPEEWLAAKKAHPFVRFTRAKSPDMPDTIPFVGDFARTDEQKDLLALLTAASDLGRPFLMSGDVPADRVAIIRRGFEATMKDPAFLGDAKRLQLVVHPVSGEEAAQIFAKIATVPPAIVEKAQQIFE